MLETIKTLFPFIIILAVLVLIMSVTSFMLTRQFDKKKVGLYSWFLDINPRIAVLFATTIFNVVFVTFAAVTMQSFNTLYMLIILLTTIISMVMSFNFRIIIVEFISSLVSVVMVNILALLRTYLSDFYGDFPIEALKIMLVATTIVFVVLMAIRKSELLLKQNKYVKRSAS